MSTQLPKGELEKLSKFQIGLHYRKNEQDPITSVFHKDIIKSTWYKPALLKLNVTSSDEIEAVYQVNSGFNYLFYTYLRWLTPAINVKKEYANAVRIAWTHNVGSNIINNAYFKFDDDIYHTWDNVWYDIYYQFFQKEGAGKREAHNIGIGNVKFLESWQSSLPQYPINIDQPWFYSMDPALSLPIFYKHSQTRAEHRYFFKRKISDLLRVQIKSGGKWIDIDDPKNYEKLLDVDPHSLIKLPELWGRYALITADELVSSRSKPKHVMYTRDVVSCDVKNPNNYKSTAEIELHCTNPCLSFFWVAQNVDSSKMHNYSNYTTETSDVYNGWDPIKTTSLLYGTDKILDDMPSDHFSLAQPRYHFPSAPSEAGYHGYSNAWDSTCYDGDVGTIFNGKNAKLECKIDNGDLLHNMQNDSTSESVADLIIPDRDDNYIDPENSYRGTSKASSSYVTSYSPQFSTHTRLYVMRKLKIKKQGDDVYNFSIE